MGSIIPGIIFFLIKKKQLRYHEEPLLSDRNTISGTRVVTINGIANIEDQRPGSRHQKWC